MGQVTVGTAVVEPADLIINDFRSVLILKNISTGGQIIYADEGKGTGLTTSNASIALDTNQAINLERPAYTFALANKWSFVSNLAGGTLAYFQTMSSIAASTIRALGTQLVEDIDARIEIALRRGTVVTTRR